MQPSSNSNLALLANAVTMIAIGTAGPLAVLLLASLFLVSKGINGLASAQLGAGLVGLSCFLLGMVAFVGQVLCFFSPLSQDTKTKLGVCMVCGVLSFVPFIGFLFGLVSLIAYLFFLYGLCTDLRAPHLAAKFNSSAFMGLLAILFCFGSIFAVFVIGPAAMLGWAVGFVLGLFSFARYVQTIISLAVQAHTLKASAPQVVEATGFTPFEPAAERMAEASPQLAREQARPEFHLENEERIQLPAELPVLHEAVRIGDAEKVASQLRPGRIDQSGPGGLTPLQVAAISGVMQVADLLIRKGAVVDAPCEGGLTALYFAIQNNNANLVGLLLSRGASLSHRDDFGRTPLHWACAVPSPRLDGQARLRMVQMLLSKGADREALDNQGKTAMQLAVEAGHDELTVL